MAPSEKSVDARAPSPRTQCFIYSPPTASQGKRKCTTVRAINLLKLSTDLGIKTAREVLNGEHHDADIQIMTPVPGLGTFLRTAVDVSHPHPTTAAMQNRTSKQIFHEHSQSLVSKTYNSKCRSEVVERLRACEVNARPLVIGTHGEIDPRSLSLIKCIAASASGHGYWKDKTTALTKHILTAITLNLFRAKATMLIRV